jgi:hypothetical protein
VIAAAVAAGDPPSFGELGEVSGGQFGDRGGKMGVAGRCYEVHRLVEDEILAQIGHVLILRFRAIGVPEDERHVDVTGPQHSQRLGRLGLGEPQVDVGVTGTKRRRGGRDQGAERRRERRQPQPSGPQPGVGGELALGRVQPADDLGGPLREQPAGVGKPDPAPGPLNELGAGLGFQPGKMMADRWLGVVELLRVTEPCRATATSTLSLVTSSILRL